MITTQAWILDAGPAPEAGAPAEPATLRFDTFSFPDLEADEVLVEPIYGSWEANMDHAIRRDPVDICRQRAEPQVVVGNGAVVRVLTTGADVTGLREGDLCLTVPFSRTDRAGYIELVHAYDCPGTVGVLAKRTKLPSRLLLPIPADSRHSSKTWALYLRYFSAWDNWKVAQACWRSQNSPDPGAVVFAWGGGVALLELELAKRDGFRVAMTSGTDSRLEEIESRGITPVDRRQFPDLAYRPEVFAEDRDARELYKESERGFLKRIDEITDGRGAAIAVDHIGGSVYRATIKALARQGVLATMGWKNGMKTWNLRATEGISRHIHVHTHVWRYSDNEAIRDSMEQADWIPRLDGADVYDFQDIPKLAADYSSGAIDSYFPIYQVNSE